MTTKTNSPEGWEGKEGEVLARRLLALAGGSFSPLAAAESCTGGLASAMLTAVPGASECFGFGVVSYSNRAKTDFLEVSPGLLEEFGAVSEEVAEAMCAGLLSRGAGSGFSITGIAGPGGGTLEKPAGTVCFGWGAQGFGIGTTTKLFPGDRDEVRRQSALFILRQTADALEEWGRKG